MRTVVLASVLAAWIALAVCPMAKATVINFDSIDTSQGAVYGTPVYDYLSGFGITVSGVTPPGVQPMILPPSSAYTPSSLPNSFAIGLVNNSSGDYATLNFPVPLTSFSFSRIQENAGPHSFSAWSMTAYDGATQLATVSEGIHGGSGYPAQTFTLTGSHITSVTIYECTFNYTGNWTSFDDIVLTEVPVPEPAGLLLLGLAGLGLASRRVRN